MPWTRSPFFNELIKNSNHTDNEIKQLKKFNRDGYLVIDLCLEKKEIENIHEEMFSLTNKTINEI